jgi:predicted RNA-binding protein with PUA-like domain
MHYWLFKSEPETFGIDHLVKCPKQTEPWNGVRNYQVRNMLRSEIKVGDRGFFYHSNCTPPGIVGIVEVVKQGYPDPTAWDKKSSYFDPKSSPENPRWYMVDVKLIKKFDHMITLERLKQEEELKNMFILRKGNRLSITPISPTEWKIINDLKA